MSNYCGGPTLLVSLSYITPHNLLSWQSVGFKVLICFSIFYFIL